LRIRHLALLAPALLLAGVAFSQSPSDDEVAVRLQSTAQGTRVILEFSGRPHYEVRQESGNVIVTVMGSFKSIPFKSKRVEEPALEHFKLDRGSRQTQLIFTTGSEFAAVSSFEMSSPFRLILEFQKKVAAAPGAATSEAPPPPHTPVPIVPSPPAPAVPGEAPGTEPAPRGPVSVPTRAPGIQVIVVDAGHGGSETGAKGPTGLLEKDVTLDMAKRIKAGLLKRLGVHVILTRDTDRQVGLDDRTAVANHERADLFLSIHVNASPANRARGAETYFLSYQATDDEARAAAALENNTLGVENPKTDTALGMVLWDLAQSQYLADSSRLAEGIQRNLNDLLRIESRGVKQAPFKVLMGATMPAVLVEIGFITNPEEEERLKQDSYRDRIAQAIVDSVAAFKERSEKQLGIR
jgi:N-acetylmuramoyl-L-alanine amidase